MNEVIEYAILTVESGGDPNPTLDVGVISLFCG